MNVKSGVFVVVIVVATSSSSTFSVAALVPEFDINFNNHDDSKTTTTEIARPSAMAAKQVEQKRWWNPDNLKDVAESVGIATLSNEGIAALQEEVEYRVFMVIQESKRFMQLGKRTVLNTTDIAQGLKVLEVEPLYGYESVRPLRFGEASMGPGQPLFYIEDEEVDFEKLINAPLPKVPRDMSFTGMNLPTFKLLF